MAAMGAYVPLGREDEPPAGEQESADADIDVEIGLEPRTGAYIRRIARARAVIAGAQVVRAPHWKQILSQQHKSYQLHRLSPK